MQVTFLLFAFVCLFLLFVICCLLFVVCCCSSRNTFVRLFLAKRNDAEAIEVLLGAGVDVNFCAAWSGWTALHRAAERGAVAAIRCLLAHGASVDARDSAGRTPLMDGMFIFCLGRCSPSCCAKTAEACGVFWCDSDECPTFS